MGNTCISERADADGHQDSSNALDDGTPTFERLLVFEELEEPLEEWSVVNPFSGICVAARNNGQCDHLNNKDNAQTKFPELNDEPHWAADDELAGDDDACTGGDGSFREGSHRHYQDVRLGSPLRYQWSITSEVVLWSPISVVPDDNGSPLGGRSREQSLRVGAAAP